MDVGLRATKLLFFTWALYPLLTVNGWPQVFEAADDDDCECLPFYQCNNEYGGGVIGPRQKTCAKSEDVCCPYIDEPTPAVPTPEGPTPEGPTPPVPTPAGPTPAGPTPPVPSPAGPTPEGPTPPVPTPAGPPPAGPTPAGPTPPVPSPAGPTPEGPTPPVPSPVAPKRKPLSPLIQNECGIRNFDGIGFKILAGEETVLGEFPWMVAIMSEKFGREKFVCGGSLIHSQVVLTAAHCIDLIDKGDLIARGGALDFNRTTEQIRPQQNRKVQEIIIHKDYEKEAALYDVALLILEEPYAEAENLGIICLPTQEKIVYEGCIVTGWGKNGTDGVLQEGLKLVELPIVPRDQCQALLRKTRLGKRFKLHESFICAGGDGADSCEGDGGGPLICPIKDGKKMQYQQVGIVSWGIDCGVAPGVYVNVVLFVDWIKEQMDTVGFQPSY